jgi:hypothetical protein
MSEKSRAQMQFVMTELWLFPSPSTITVWRGVKSLQFVSVKPWRYPKGNFETYDADFLVIFVHFLFSFRSSLLVDDSRQKPEYQAVQSTVHKSCFPIAHISSATKPALLKLYLGMYKFNIQRHNSLYLRGRRLRLYVDSLRIQPYLSQETSTACESGGLAPDKNTLLL